MATAAGASATSAEEMEAAAATAAAAVGYHASDVPEYYMQLASFVIEKKIGRGQFSVVCRARCIRDGSVVALKKVQVRGARVLALYGGGRAGEREGERHIGNTAPSRIHIENTARLS